MPHMPRVPEERLGVAVISLSLRYDVAGREVV